MRAATEVVCPSERRDTLRGSWVGLALPWEREAPLKPSSQRFLELFLSFLENPLFTDGCICCVSWL